MKIVAYVINEFYRDNDNYGTARRVNEEDEFFATRERAEEICAELNRKYPAYDGYFKRDHYDVSEVEIVISDEVTA